MGRWYEWARFETPFEYDLDDVYAEYELKNDGSVSITNYGTDKKGHQSKAHAVGKIAGKGMLSISFIPILHFPASSYRVLYVDDAYNYALVSDKKGSCLWFLGRTPQASKEALNILKYEADVRGFHTENLRYTAQGS
jgi:apolipoprotein D and lipocalin family protein